MKNEIRKSSIDDINRKEAIIKIVNYSKYAAFTAIGTYMILNHKKTQAQSPGPPEPGGWQN